MQFIASTWARFGVDAEGNGPPDRWNPADAIFAAANCCARRAPPAIMPRAIFAYNHASWYVAEVESWASRYSAAAAAQSAAGEGARPEGADTARVGESPTPVLFVAGSAG